MSVPLWEEEASGGTYLSRRPEDWGREEEVPHSCEITNAT